jgi:hypothetical protein
VVALSLHLGHTLVVALVSYAVVCALFAVGMLRAAALARRGPPRATSNRAPPSLPAPATIAFLGDVQRGVREVAGPVVEAIGRERATLLVSSGDLASHGEGPYHGIVGAAFDRAGLSVPLLVAPGNHDVERSGRHGVAPGRALFEETVGPRRWTARVGPLLLAGIDNSVDPFDADLWPWLEGVAAAHAGPWILVVHRPPLQMFVPGTPVGDGLAPLVDILDRHPPAVVVSGHLSRDAEAVRRGVRHIVNAEGGDVAGSPLRAPPTFRLLLVDVDAAGAVTVRRADLRRRLSLATASDQFLVRLWAEGRRIPGALFAAPARLLLRCLGVSVPGSQSS